MADIGDYSTIAHGTFGVDYFSFIHLTIEANRTYQIYQKDISTQPKTETFLVRKMIRHPIYKFSYEYLYSTGDTYAVGVEKVEAVIYTLQDAKDTDGRQMYFMFGYNRPRIIVTNETVNSAFIEKMKITETKTDTKGKEYSVKSYPVFEGYEMVPRYSKDAQWQE